MLPVFPSFDERMSADFAITTLLAASPDAVHTLRSSHRRDCSSPIAAGINDIRQGEVEY